MRTRLHAVALAAVLALGSVAGTSTSSATPATDAVAVHRSFLALYNGERWQEIHDFYAADAILAPPNHDLVHGRDAIVEFFRTARPVFGELAGVSEPAVVRAADATSILSTYEFKNGVRLVATEVYVRQPDGRYKCKLDQFGFRDPLT